MTPADDPHVSLAAPVLPAWLVLLMATACGLIAANLYYAQPLIGLIAPALSIPPQPPA
jgi:hypothetical protein